MNPIITASLTGPVASTRDNPAVPSSPEEVAQSARAAYEAGAAVLHIHLRENDAPTTDLQVAEINEARPHCFAPMLSALPGDQHHAPSGGACRFQQSRLACLVPLPEALHGNQGEE